MTEDSKDLVRAQELAEDGVNTFAMRSDVSLDDAGWGSPTFHKMVRLL